MSALSSFMHLKMGIACAKMKVFLHEKRAVLPPKMGNQRMIIESFNPEEMDVSPADECQNKYLKTENSRPWALIRLSNSQLKGLLNKSQGRYLAPLPEGPFHGRFLRHMSRICDPCVARMDFHWA